MTSIPNPGTAPLSTPPPISSTKTSLIVVFNTISTNYCCFKVYYLPTIYKMTSTA